MRRWWPQRLRALRAAAACVGAGPGCRHRRRRPAIPGPLVEPDGAASMATAVSRHARNGRERMVLQCT
eukprot:8468769-Pyramimonas_sp.AAC.1